MRLLASSLKLWVVGWPPRVCELAVLKPLDVENGTFHTGGGAVVHMHDLKERC